MCIRDSTSASSALEALTASANPEEQATEVLQRRTEADGGAVMVMTVHVSKGLENRVVMVPYLWTAPMNVTAPVVTHDPVSGEAMLRVALETKGEARDAAKAAVAEEGDRLAYVALTRAKEQLIEMCIRDSSRRLRATITMAASSSSPTSTAFSMAPRRHS